MGERRLTRRGFLRLSTTAATGALMAACAPATPQVVTERVVETVVVEKQVAVEKEVVKEVPVEKIVVKEVPVEKEVVKEVEKVITATPAPKKAPERFYFWTWGDYRFFEDAYKRMQADYPQYAQTRWENLQTKGGEHMQRLLVGWAAGDWKNLPDVAELSSGSIPEMSDAGVLLDLTELIAPHEKNLGQSTLQGVTRKGRVWACPWMAECAMIWYRNDVFEMAGVNVDDIETWDDFTLAGQQVTQYDYPDGKKRYMVGMPSSGRVGSGFRQMVGQQGGAYMDPESGETLVGQDDRIRRAFETIVGFEKAGMVLRIEEWEPPWYAALQEGVIAAYISANWMDQIIQLQMPDTKGMWRAMALPAFDKGGNRYTLSGIGTVVAINKPGLDKDLAWAFMEHSFFNDTVPVELDKVWKLTPAYLPALRNPFYQEASDFYGGQNTKQLELEIIENANFIPYTDHQSEIERYITTELTEAVAGNKTIDEALTDAANTIRKQVGTAF